APPYQTGQIQSGIAVTGVASVDALCRMFEVARVEPFYPGKLRKPALRREISRMYIFTFADGVDPLPLLNTFVADPNIELAEPYNIQELNYVPNDPRAVDQWYLAHTHAYEAWDVIRGDTTRHAVIGIVDSGVDWNHPDLISNIWVNPGEDINHNGIYDQSDLNQVDDDSNGYIDDIIGWDLYGNDNNPVEPSPIHGTGVAGCASERTDNDTLGAAIGWGARIMCLRVTNEDGYVYHGYQGIAYAADNGAQIINISWGDVNFSQANQNFFDAIWAGGALVVASAGALSDTSRMYPAAYNHVMAVAGTDNQDHRASFSSYGHWIDICAPGVDIWTTFGPSGFINYSGTSFSAAMVSGLAGLVCARHPDYTNDQIENVIELSADTIPNNNGLLGAGRINCASAVNMVLSETSDEPKVPHNFVLYANYPNPFNAQTTISYNLARGSFISIEIFDLLGRKVGSLVSQYQDAGPHSVIWDAEDFSSGLYYYRLQAGDHVQSKRCLLLK
ncbi:MAG TPA: hypothetical protein DEO84_06250, partial [candidate division Zixibacteria bacterium]|nr:hypothetical protein [candidate division Zixibacteria bacterium]